MLTLSTVTTSFKLPPLTIRAEWLETLRRAWNESLGLLYWRQYYLRSQVCEQQIPVRLDARKVVVYSWKPGAEKATKKEFDEWALSCPIGRDERIDPRKSWDAKNLVWKPFKWQQEDGHYCCPVDADRSFAWDGWWVKPLWLDLPPIASYELTELRKPFAKSRCDWLGDIPQTYVNDYIELVAHSAWTRYQKGEFGRPKFKKQSDRVETISCQSFRAVGTLTLDRFAVPGVEIVSRKLQETKPGKYAEAVVDNYFLAELQRRLIDPLDRVAEAMRSNPERFEVLQERLNEGDRFRQVLAILRRGEPLPDVGYPLGAEIKEGLDKVEKFGLEEAIAKLQKRLPKAKPDKAERLQQVIELLQTGEPLPQPHPLRIEVLAAEKLIEAKGLEAAIAKLTERVSDRQLDASIAHLTTPGSFCLTREEGEDFVNITHLKLINVTPCDRSVGIDVGLDYLYTTTTGVKVKHQDFTHEERRVAALQRVLDTKEHGSANYNKLQAKIKGIQGSAKRSKRKHQEYHAAWQTDNNGSLAVKHFKPKEVAAVPEPIPDSEGTHYVRNGRGDARLANKALSDAALGQFVALLQQKSGVKGRTFEKVEIEPEATHDEVLEVSSANLSSPVLMGTQAQSSETGAWEGEGATLSELGESGNATPSDRPNRKPKPKQAPVYVSEANTPIPPEVKRKRNRKKERAIG